MRFQPALLQSIVERGQHLRGIEALHGGGAHDAADQCGKERSGRGFAADVAENDGGLAGAVFHEVVEVAADGARGQESHRHFGMGMLRRMGREQAELHFARHGDVALKLLLLAPDGLIEARILNGDCDLRGHGGKQCARALR